MERKSSFSSYDGNGFLWPARESSRVNSTASLLSRHSADGALIRPSDTLKIEDIPTKKVDFLQNGSGVRYINGGSDFNVYSELI